MQNQQKPVIGHYAFLYACQFGPFRSKGAKYIAQILRRYADDNFTAGALEYKRFIEDAAAEKGLRPTSFRRTIQRYIEKGWSLDYAKSWETYTGWKQNFPPKTNTAIRLICESFTAFMKSWVFTEGKQRFYVQTSIEEDQEGESTPSLEHEFFLDEISSHTHYASFDDPEELRAYVWYLTYRVQKDFYNLCIESKALVDCPWQDFVLGMRGSKETRDSAAFVLRKTIEEFLSHAYFNFDKKEPELLDDSDDPFAGTDTMNCAKLISYDEGCGLIDAILLQAEFVQYRRQLNQGKDYSWEQYIEELLQDKQMWHEIKLAFLDALERLDFRAVWESEELQGG